MTQFALSITAINLTRHETGGTAQPQLLFLLWYQTKHALAWSCLSAQQGSPRSRRHFPDPPPATHTDQHRGFI